MENPEQFTPGVGVNGYEIFIKKALKHEVLSTEQSQGLFREMQAGRMALAGLSSIDVAENTVSEAEIKELELAISAGEEARGILILNNLRFVSLCAQRVQRSKPGTESREDMIQDGVMGLIRAIDDFDLDLGFSLTTYAAMPITKSIEDGMKRQAEARHNGVLKDAEIRAVGAAMAEREIQSGTVNLDEVSQETGVPVDRIIRSGITAGRHRYERTSIEAETETGRELFLHDPSAASELSAIELQETTNSFLGQAFRDGVIDDRGLMILKLKHGFFSDGEEQSFEKVAARLGASEYSVRQKYHACIKSLRQRADDLGMSLTDIL